MDLEDEVRELRLAVNALQRDHDDLDESFRRWRSRRSKTDALDAADEPREAASKGSTNGRLPTVAQLKSTGRWPLR